MPHAHDHASHANGHDDHAGHNHDHGDHDHGDHDHAGHDHGGHGHGGHSHGLGGHVHAPASFGRAFAIGIGLNTIFVAAEAAFGVLADSTALLADAGHNLGDVLGLVVAWVAAMLVTRRPTRRFTYGLGSSSILAALFNGVLLLVAVGAIGWEAILRLKEPVPVAGAMVTIVALVGIAVNGATAWLFARGRHGDLNVRGAYLHMLADAAVSAGVVVSGLVILATGWSWIDPLVSLVIVAVIVGSSWGLVRDALSLSMQAVPAGIDSTAVEAFLCGRPGVARVHDLHIWAMSTSGVALTCHLVMPDGHPGDDFLVACMKDLDKRFGIAHSTLQIEAGRSLSGQATLCPLESEAVV